MLIILGMVWITFLWFMIGYAKDVRTDPCTFCAKLHGEDVTCQTAGRMRIYHENGSIENIGTGGLYNSPPINLDKYLPDDK